MLEFVREAEDGQKVKVQVVPFIRVVGDGDFQRCQLCLRRKSDGKTVEVVAIDSDGQIDNSYPWVEGFGLQKGFDGCIASFYSPDYDDKEPGDGN